MAVQPGMVEHPQFAQGDLLYVSGQFLRTDSLEDPLRFLRSEGTTHDLIL